MSMQKANAKMTGHVCVARKGPPPNWRAEFAAPGADVDDVIYDGTLISLNSSGQFIKGCGVGDGINLPMPMWALKNTTDAGVTQWGNNAFSGSYNGLVATGGYEIETSEFDSTKTYAVNDAVVPDAITAGRVTKATEDVYGETPVVGIVSAACSASALTVNGETGTTTLRFWSVFIPGKPTSSDSSSASESAL